MALTAVETRNQEGIKAANRIAMSVVLVSFSMLFATLFLGFFVYRFSENVWPPQGIERLSLSLPLQSSFAIGLSSLLLFFFQKRYELSHSRGINKEDQRILKYFLLGALLGGFIFLFCQVRLWEYFKASDLFVGDGVFQSILYSFTYLHAVHIGLGLLTLMYLMPTTFKANLSKNYVNRISNVAKFWHFLGVIWVLMFIILFVI